MRRRPYAGSLSRLDSLIAVNNAAGVDGLRRQRAAPSSIAIRKKSGVGELRFEDIPDIAITNPLLLIDRMVKYYLNVMNKGAFRGAFFLANQRTTSISDAKQAICLPSTVYNGDRATLVQSDEEIMLGLRSDTR